MAMPVRTKKMGTKLKSPKESLSTTLQPASSSSTALNPGGGLQMEDLRIAFRLLDKDNDGRITLTEFQEMLKNFGIVVPEAHVTRVLERASSTGSPKLSEDDFLKWISPFLENDETPDQDLIAAFQVFDKDGNGFITKDELKSAMDMIGEIVSEDDLNEMLAIADIDLDGRIDYGEFARLLT